MSHATCDVSVASDVVLVCIGDDDLRRDVTATLRGEWPVRTAHDDHAATESLDEAVSVVVVDLTVENAGSESQGLPAPSPAPLAATGNVFISGRDNQAGNRGIPAASVAGPLVRDGEAARGYGYNVAALNWTLPPGDSVGGWIAFRVDGDYDLGENDIMVRIDNAAARWALRG